MKVQTTLQQVNRLFLDSAPVIYYVDMILRRYEPGIFCHYGWAVQLH